MINRAPDLLNRAVAKNAISVCSIKQSELKSDFYIHALSLIPGRSIPSIGDHPSALSKYSRNKVDAVNEVSDNIIEVASASVILTNYLKSKNYHGSKIAIT